MCELTLEVLQSRNGGGLDDSVLFRLPALEELYLPTSRQLLKRPVRSQSLNMHMLGLDWLIQQGGRNVNIELPTECTLDKYLCYCVKHLLRDLVYDNGAEWIGKLSNGDTIYYIPLSNYDRAKERIYQLVGRKCSNRIDSIVRDYTNLYPGDIGALTHLNGSTIGVNTLSVCSITYYWIECSWLVDPYHIGA
jgi:hypothetical protein